MAVLLRVNVSQVGFISAASIPVRDLAQVRVLFQTQNTYPGDLKIGEFLSKLQQLSSRAGLRACTRLRISSDPPRHDMERD